MVDEKKVVNLAVEPAPQIDRTPQVVEEQAPQPEPIEQTPEEQQTIPVVPPTNEAVDEFGVPWKNRAMEYKRKSEEFVDRIPQLIEEKLQKVVPNQAPQYTYEQLELYKQQNATDPNVVAWTVAEQRKIQLAEQKKLIEEVVGSREHINKVEMQKQAALNYVQQTYPEAFKHDNQGRIVAWDEASPMTQTIRALMQRADLMNHPEGLSAAADIAYGRLARTQSPALQKKAEQLKADVKQAQKASLTEGSGRRVVVTTTPVNNALDGLRKTGSIKDAESAVGAILRQKGLIGE